MTGSKKNLDLTVNEKREAIKHDHKDISVSRQCELLGLSRSAYYYKAKEVNTRNLFGSGRLSDRLAEQGFPACRSKVGRLKKVMGILSIRYILI